MIHPQQTNVAESVISFERMPWGPDIPQWRELSAALANLAESARASNAYVLDARGVLWCSAHSFDSVDQPLLVHLLEAAHLDDAPSKTSRGPAPLDQIISGGDGHAYVKSYLSSHVVLVRFAGPFDVLKARTEVALALPKIATLTASLPPSDGPGSDSASAAKRA